MENGSAKARVRDAATLVTALATKGPACSPVTSEIKVLVFRGERGEVSLPAVLDRMLQGANKDWSAPASLAPLDVVQEGPPTPQRVWNNVA